MEEEKQEKTMEEKLKENTEKEIERILKEGIKTTNIDFLSKVVDIHKDLANEEYWQNKKEVMNMRYRGYSGNEIGNYGDYREYGEYSDGNYGRRERDSRGRYMARGYDTKYRGHDMIDDMYHNYEAYSEGREEYGRGNYGAKEDTMKSLDYMMKSVVQFVKMLQQDAGSHEETELIKKYTKQISEM